MAMQCHDLKYMHHIAYETFYIATTETWVRGMPHLLVIAFYGAGHVDKKK